MQQQGRPLLQDHVASAPSAPSFDDGSFGLDQPLPTAIADPVYPRSGSGYMEFDGRLAAELAAEDAQRQQPLIPNNKRRGFHRDKDHKVKFVPFTIAANCIMFIVTMAVANFELASFQTNPMIGPEPGDLNDSGGQTTYLITCKGQWWRLFTSMYVHAGVLHLGMNMGGLYRLGYDLEKEFGWKRISVIYFLSGLVGQLASAVFLPEFVSIGASGAIFGLFGSQWADFVQNVCFFKKYKGRSEMCVKMLFSTAVAIAFTLVPLVNAFAHIGGFLFGMCVGFVLFVRGRYIWNYNGEMVKKNYKTYQFLLSFVSLGLMLVTVLTLVILLTTGQNAYDFCPSCEYLECFETPFWDCNSMKVASCGYQQQSTTQPCLDLGFPSEGDCFLVTCTDNSIAPSDIIPTPSICYDLCGSEGNVC